MPKLTENIDNSKIDWENPCSQGYLLSQCSKIFLRILSCGHSFSDQKLLNWHLIFQKQLFIFGISDLCSKDCQIKSSPFLLKIGKTSQFFPNYQM